MAFNLQMLLFYSVTRGEVVTSAYFYTTSQFAVRFVLFAAAVLAFQNALYACLKTYRIYRPLVHFPG